MMFPESRGRAADPERDVSFTCTQVNSDGNDIGGLRSHILRRHSAPTPAGTCEGLALAKATRPHGYYIPFAITKRAPRGGRSALSLEERYVTTAGYVNAVRPPLTNSSASG